MSKYVNFINPIEDLKKENKDFLERAMNTRAG